MITSPDHIVFGPDRPSEANDTFYNEPAAWARMYLNEITPAVQMVPIRLIDGREVLGTIVDETLTWAAS